MNLPLRFEWWQPLSLLAGATITGYFLATGGVVEGSLLLLLLIVGLAGRVYIFGQTHHDVDIDPAWGEQ